MLRGLSERVCAELRDLEDVTRVELVNARPAEIAVTLSEAALQRHGLTPAEVAARIEQGAREFSAGVLRTDRGEIVLQTSTRKKHPHDYLDLPVLTTPTGGVVRLRDLAQVSDAFGVADLEMTFNGQPAQQIVVYRVGNETPARTAQAVRAYVERLQPTLPEGTTVRVLMDHADEFAQRQQFLFNDAIQGIALVFIMLALFFEVRLAFWVMMGIPTAVLGGMLFMPAAGVSINMLTLVALILTFGIVTDDAIMIGEAIYYRRERGDPPFLAAVRGLRQTWGLVCMVVLTNILGFVPMFFVESSFKPIFLQIPAVVIAVFVVSLIEALFIFPAHVAHAGPPNRLIAWLNRPQQWINAWLEGWMQHVYARWIRSIIAHPGLFAIAVCGVLGVTATLMTTGHVKFSFAPQMDSDRVTANATLPHGCSLEQARHVRAQLVAAAQAVVAAHGGPSILDGITAVIGSPISNEGHTDESDVGNHYVGIEVALSPLDRRTITGIGFADAWREQAGQLTGVDALKFVGTADVTADEALVIELRHPDAAAAQGAAARLTTALRAVPGIASVDSGLNRQKPKFGLTLKPEAERMGLTAEMLATQLRHRFHGAEALRFRRGESEVRVMVRLPDDERTRFAALDAITITAPDGRTVPLAQVASIEHGRSPAKIERADGARIFPVRATTRNDADDALIRDRLENGLLPQLLRECQGLSYEIAGEAREVEDTLNSLTTGTLLVGLLLYAFLAIRFNSYLQPVLIMSVIPLGAIGAIWGHVLFGSSLSIMSIIGMIAMAGVVVNESLVFVAAANEFVDEGLPPHQAVVQAAIRRFRPILLTSITTFSGLFPILTETSEQARFISPMIISMSFGQVFTTAAVLIALPNLYLLLSRRRSANAALHRDAQPSSSETPVSQLDRVTLPVENTTAAALAGRP
jgi:multidrug efflux pump subunit AcrB